MKTVIRLTIGALSGIGAWFIVMLIAVLLTPEKDIKGLALTLASILLFTYVGIGVLIADSQDKGKED